MRACLRRGRPARASLHRAPYKRGGLSGKRSNSLPHTGPAILIGREHGRTLLVSDDRSSGAPAQKSKQHQDYTSDSHNVLLLSFAAVICWKHAITLVCPAPRKMRDMRPELPNDREPSPH